MIGSWSTIIVRSTSFQVAVAPVEYIHSLKPDMQQSHIQSYEASGSEPGSTTTPPHTARVAGEVDGPLPKGFSSGFYSLGGSSAEEEVPENCKCQAEGYQRCGVVPFDNSFHLDDSWLLEDKSAGQVDFFHIINSPQPPTSCLLAQQSQPLSVGSLSNVPTAHMSSSSLCASKLTTASQR